MLLLWGPFLLLGATSGWHTAFLIVVYFNDLVCTQWHVVLPWRWFGYHWARFGSGPRWERRYFGSLLDYCLLRCFVFLIHMCTLFLS